MIEKSLLSKNVFFAFNARIFSGLVHVLIIPVKILQKNFANVT